MVIFSGITNGQPCMDIERDPIGSLDTLMKNSHLSSSFQAKAAILIVEKDKDIYHYPGHICKWQVIIMLLLCLTHLEPF